MSRTEQRMITKARKGWAHAAAERAEAKSVRAERKAQRHERHGRRFYLEALRLADLAEA